MRHLFRVGLSALAAVPLLSAQQQPTFRSEISTVSIYATVRSSSGHLVTDLTKEDFEVKDNGAGREITVFSRELVPITVALLLDMSGSQEVGVDWMRQGANAFVNRMLPADRARIGTFGTEIALSPKLTSDQHYLRRVLREELWPGGPTPLWEALDLAMSSLPSELKRRVLLVLTDGFDSTPPPITMKPTLNIAVTGNPVTPASKALGQAQSAWNDQTGKYATVRGRAAAQGFLVYAVGHRTPGGMTPSALSDQMQALAVESGGGYRVFEESKNASAALEAVAEELHRQYLIGFVPTVLDGKVHRLEVNAKRAGLTVQTRKNYVAAKTKK